MSEGRIRIRLAAPSLLFAPFYLAKKLAEEEALGDFHIMRRVSFDYARSSRGRDSIDDLVEPVVRAEKAPKGASVHLLAAGDPMRMISAVNRMNRDQPYLVGGLIEKMCFWLVDSVTLNAGESIADKFDKILVHPRGMTGYSLMYYELSKLGGKCDAEIRSILSQYSPGRESVWYRTLSFSRRCSDRAREYGRLRRGEVGVVSKHVAFLASDPLMGFKLDSGYSSPYFESVKSYHDARFADFQRVLMTGLITGRNLYHNNNDRRRQIDDIVSALVRALELIRSEPELSAYYVLRYADDRISFSRRHQLKDLEETFQHLAQSNVFLSREGLAPTSIQIQRSLDIRKSVGIEDEVERLASISNNLTDFCRFIDDRVEEGGDNASPSLDVRLSLYQKAVRKLLPKKFERGLRTWQLLLGCLMLVLLLVCSRLAPNRFPAYDLASILLGLVTLVPASADLFEVAQSLKVGGKDSVDVGLLEGLATVFVVTFLTFSLLDSCVKVGGFGASDWPNGAVAAVTFCVCAACMGLWVYSERKTQGFSRALENVRIRLVSARDVLAAGSLMTFCVLSWPFRTGFSWSLLRLHLAIGKIKTRFTN